MCIINKTIFSTVIASLLSSTVHAGTVEGVLTFEKRNPYVALAYFSDAADGGPDVCGTLDQKDKAFSEMLVVGKTGCDIQFHNSDDTDHNIFANDLESGVGFDVGLIPPGGDASTVVNWNEGRLVRLGCKIHPKMVSYIANLPTKRYTIIEFESGDLETKFAVADVAAESVQFELVLEPLDQVSVTLKPGESVEVDVTYKGKVFGKLALSR